MLDETLAQSSLIRLDFLAENRSLIDRVSLCLSWQSEPEMKFLTTLPCFDNNVWVTYPELEKILASRLTKNPKVSHQTFSFLLLRSLKRSIPGVAVELLFRLFSPRFRVCEKIGGSESRILGFTYSNLDPLDSNFFNNSKFWGPLPSWLKSRIETTWLGLDSKRPRQKFENDIRQTRLILGACIRFLKSFRKRWRFWRSLRSRCSDIEIFSIIQKEYRRAIMGSPAFEAEYFEAMFNDLLAKTSAKTVLIPHENQLWERVLCMSAKQKGLRVLGFLHTTPRFWDLRFFDFGRWDILQPNLFISGGKAYERVLLEGGVSHNRILKATALRFQHLSTKRTFEIDKCTIDQPVRVLVVTGVNRTASTELIKLVSQANLPGLTSIRLRPHPGNAEWIKRKFPEYETEDRDFESYLSEYSLFVTDSVSSLALEFANFGKRTAVFVKGDSLNFSPLYFFTNFDSYFWDSHSLSKMLTTNSAILGIREMLDLPNQMDIWLTSLGKVVSD